MLYSILPDGGSRTDAEQENVFSTYPDTDTLSPATTRQDHILEELAASLIGNNVDVSAFLTQIGQSLLLNRAFFVQLHGGRANRARKTEWCDTQTVPLTQEALTSTAFSEILRHLELHTEICLDGATKQQRNTELHNNVLQCFTSHSVYMVALAAPNKSLLGLLGIAVDHANRRWQEDECRFIRTVAHMLAQHLEGGRIAEEARLRQRQLVQADKMASLGILVSGVAHEINNPNLFIMSNADILAEVWQNVQPLLDTHCEEQGDIPIAGTSYLALRTEIPELCAGILEGAEHIKRIVQELRDYVRECPAELSEPVDVNAVVKSANVLLSSMIKKSTTQFHVHAQPNIPKILGNSSRLEQVVINLVQNACQALHSKESAITITTRYETIANVVIIEVCDEGMGIVEDALPHITDPFYTTKRESGGTGLGLSISSTIINEHEGMLEFNSVPGKGTTARVILPVRHDHPAHKVT